MKKSARSSWPLSVLVLLCGFLLCGCGGRGYQGTTGGGPGGAGGITSPPPSSGPNVAGNWQFSTTSTAGGTPATIAGGINQTGSAVNGAVHVEGLRCFDRLTTIGLTGTLTGSNISLTSTTVDGQVITLTGRVSDDTLNGADSAFAGTYTIDGGCGNGDHGNVTGIRIPFIANIVNGTFTTSGGETFDVVGDEAQVGTPSSEGSFGITGTVSFSTPCFSSGTITPGTFPSGSFIIGTSVALEIETGNGTVTFLGTLNRDRSEIRGNYKVGGGTCDDTGTAVLVVSSPWDY
jgi:hypothetical protein